MSLAAHRRRVVRHLRSTVRITHPSDEPPRWDEETETMVPPAPLVDYEGPASVRLAGRTGKVVDAVGEAVAVRGYVVSLPAGISFPVVDATVVEVVRCPDTPALTGVQMHVKNAEQSDAQVVHRLLCEAFT